MSEIKSIGIVGAGQMGRGIAQVAAQSGYNVFLYDLNQESLDFGHNFIKKQLDRGISKEKWTQQDADAAWNRITATIKLEDLSATDLIVEAATENKKIKLH